MRICQELYHKGFADELVESAVGRSAQEWLAALSKAHNKRFGSARACDAKARAQRVWFLEYQEFPAELIADLTDGKDEF